MRTRWMVACVLLTVSAASAQTLDTYSLVRDAVEGSSGLASPSQFNVCLLASTDAQHQNKDYLMLAPQEKRTVATFAGPALLLRVWCTSGEPAKTSVQLQVDGRTIPLLNQGKATGFPPVKALGGVHEKAFFSYYPLPVRQSCQLTVVNHSEKENKFFFQINYQSASPSVRWVTPDIARWRELEERLSKTSRSSVERPTGASTKAGQGWGAAECPPQRETNLLSLKGPALISLCELVPSVTDVQTLEKIFFLIRWDDEKQPSVIAPLAWIFGQYFEKGRLQSALLQSDGKRFSLHFPMPHARTARFSIWNGHPTNAVKVEMKICYRLLPGAAPPYRFCATAATQMTERDKPFTLLNAQGEGVLVGCTVGLQGGGMSRTFSFLEGNERIEVDDDPKQTLEGTGAEDTFNSAWFFPDKSFFFPFHGMTFKGANPQRVSAYRLMLTDRVPFKKHLRFTLQHGGRNSSPGCLYRAVTFWYQKSPRTFAPRPNLAAAEQQPSASTEGLPTIFWVVALLSALAFLVYRAFLYYREVDKRKRMG